MILIKAILGNNARTQDGFEYHIYISGIFENELRTPPYIAPRVCRGRVRIIASLYI